MSKAGKAIQDAYSPMNSPRKGGKKIYQEDGIANATRKLVQRIGSVRGHWCVVYTDASWRPVTGVYRRDSAAFGMTLLHDGGVIEAAHPLPFAKINHHYELHAIAIAANVARTAGFTDVRIYTDCSKALNQWRQTALYKDLPNVRVMYCKRHNGPDYTGKHWMNLRAHDLAYNSMDTGKPFLDVMEFSPVNSATVPV